MNFLHARFPHDQCPIFGPQLNWLPSGIYLFLDANHLSFLLPGNEEAYNISLQPAILCWHCPTSMAERFPVQPLPQPPLTQSRTSPCIRNHFAHGQTCRQKCWTRVASCTALCAINRGYHSWCMPFDWAMYQNPSVSDPLEASKGGIGRSNLWGKQRWSEATLIRWPSPVISSFSIYQPGGAPWTKKHTYVWYIPIYTNINMNVNINEQVYIYIYTNIIRVCVCVRG